MKTTSTRSDAPGRHRRVPGATWVLALALLHPSGAFAGPPTIDRWYALEFAGYAILADELGDTLVVRARIVQSTSIPPLPLDFANLEHTLLVTAALAGRDWAHETFRPGTIAITSDSLAGGTRADWAAASTWTDGDCILLGDLHFIGRYLATPPEPVSVYGDYWMTQGSRIHELIYPLNTIFAFETSQTPAVPTGYDVPWTGWLQGVVDAVQPATWSAVRVLYR